MLTPVGITGAPRVVTNIVLAPYRYIRGGVPLMLNGLFLALRSLLLPTVRLPALLAINGLPNETDAIKQIFDWERDRMLTLARGLGGSAVAVVVALIGANLGGHVHGHAWVIDLSAAWLGLLLLWAAVIFVRLRRLPEQYADILSLFAG
jgi:hypothetical protein